MDPVACIRRWFEAYEADEREEMQAAADDYNGWIRREGAPVIGVLESGFMYTVWGLSANFAQGAPMSPCQLGGAERNTLLTPSAVMGIAQAARPYKLCESCGEDKPAAEVIGLPGDANSAEWCAECRAETCGYCGESISDCPRTPANPSCEPLGPCPTRKSATRFE